MSQPFDPYAAPRAAPPEQASYAGQGQSFSWEPGEVLGLAWARFKRFWFRLVAGYVVVTVIMQIGSQGPVLASILASHGPDRYAVRPWTQFAGIVVGMGVSSFFMIGLLRVWLDTGRAREPSFGTLFLGGDRFLPMFGLYVLMTLAIAGGFLLLIVPGVIVGLGLSMAPFYLVDANMGPMEAMRASWAATKGQKGKLFGLGLLSLCVMFLGLLACGLGMFASITVAYIAWAIAYTRISGRDAALPDPLLGELR